MIKVILNRSHMCVQYAHSLDLGLFVRVKYDLAETWVDWTRVDNFGCATASDLASLLGVPARFNISATEIDFSVVRNSSGAFSIPSGRGIIIFTGHETQALPAIILCNNGTYAVLGTLPSEISISITNNIVSITCGNTAFYQSNFKYLMI